MLGSYGGSVLAKESTVLEDVVNKGKGEISLLQGGSTGWRWATSSVATKATK